MLRLHLQNIGKRFNHHWIFRQINYQFISGKSYAITGPNGSGKSTLLQIIASAMQSSEGAIELSAISESDKGSLQTQPQVTKKISAENHYRFFSIATPALELIEELTLKEFLAFHFQFKPILSSCTIASIMNDIQLKDAANKQIRYFSSGMKQRVKLAQAVFSNTPAVLLDEPTTNLDAQGIELYVRLINQFCKDRLVIVCSNNEHEIAFCQERLDMGAFKKKQSHN